MGSPSTDCDKTQESFDKFYDTFFTAKEDMPKLVCNMTNEQWLDTISCPRIDPINPKKRHMTTHAGDEDLSSTDSEGEYAFDVESEEEFETDEEEKDEAEEAGADETGADEVGADKGEADKGGAVKGEADEGDEWEDASEEDEGEDAGEEVGGGADEGGADEEGAEEGEDVGDEEENE